MNEKRPRVRRIDPKTIRMLLEPLNLSGDKIRFLCTHLNGIYRLYMGNNMYREFTDDTLPPELKECIGLINAFDWDKLHKENQLTGPLSQYHTDEPHETVLLRKQTYYPEVCNDIGWRVRNRYALIVPYDYFIKLKGESESES